MPPAPGPARVLVVEHQASCPAAHFGAWLEEAGCVLEVCRPWSGEMLPDLAAYDALLVLGGEMGANDDERYPWLGPVKQAIRAAAAAQLPTLGVCLGHQLAAVALGGRVAPRPRGRALGVLTARWTAAAAEDPLVGGHTGRERGIHWNNDVVVDPPPRTVVLATSCQGDLQVARFAASVWGLQLHPEADARIVRAWAEGDRSDRLGRDIDHGAAIEAIGAAREELELAWRPVAGRLAALARTYRSRR